MAFLQLNQLTKFYGGTCVVDGMDLTVEKGEFVSLLGPSGCGKTTTLQMIAGFVDPTRGSISLDGRDITHTKPNTRGLGVVFQSYALFPHMTVTDNVAFGLAMRKVPRAETATRTREALALVQLEHLADRYPRELSGGQRQRVALARALVINPPVLLLDEPLSNLDAKLREEMQFELRRIQRKVGTTTIMVTHDQSEALSISDRVVVMEGGRATQIDVPYRMYEHPETEFISRFVGKTNMLRGRVLSQGTETQVDVGHGLHLSAAASTMTVGDEVLVSIRPEKMRLAAPGTGRLDGVVSACFFLGSQWLYSLDTPVGTLVLTTPNSGQPPLPEGEVAGIDWKTDVVRLLRAPAGSAHEAQA